MKPSLGLSRYGLGQMNIASGNYRNAATSLEQIIYDFIGDDAERGLSTGSGNHILLDSGSPNLMIHQQAGEAARALQVLSSQLPDSGKKRNWIRTLHQHPLLIQLKHDVPETFVAIAELSKGNHRVEAYKTALELYKKHLDLVTRHNALANERNESSSSESHPLPILSVPRIPLIVHNNAGVAFFELPL